MEIENLDVDSFFQTIKKKQLQIKSNIVQIENGSQLIFFAGTTGSGKSTLIACALGLKIGYKKQYGEFQINILNSNQNQPVPVIGHGNVSCTQMPGVFRCGRKILIDMAGFLDTKGIQQQIFNGFSNSCFFQKEKHVKIVMVISIDDIKGGRGGCINETIERLIQIVGRDIQKLYDSFCIVITKTDKQTGNLDYLLSKLNNIEKTNKNLSPTSKVVLRRIVNNQRVMLFSNPQAQNFDQNKFMSQLDQIRYGQLSKDGNISLSCQATNLINQGIEELQMRLNDFAKLISNQLMRKYAKKHYKTEEDLKNDWELFKKTKNMIQQWTDQLDSFNGWQNFIGQLKEVLNLNQAQFSKLDQILTMIQFFNKVKDAGSEQVCFKTSFLQIINSTILNLLADVEIVRQKILSQQKRAQQERQHQKIMERNREEFNQQIQQLEYRHHKQLQQLRAQNREIENKMIQQRKELEKKIEQTEAREREKQRQREQQRTRQYLENMKKTKPIEKPHNYAVQQTYSRKTKRIKGKRRLVSYTKTTKYSCI